MAFPTFIKPQPDGVLLWVKVQPRASRNEIGEPLGDELRIKVTAPPVDSAANEAVVRLLTKTLGVGSNSVKLLRGQTSRHKVFKVRGLEPEQMAKMLDKR